MVSLSGEQLTLFLEGVQVAEDQAAKTTYLIVAIDMTARKKAELSIQTQSILLQKVFNTAFTGLAVLDTVRSAQGEIVDFTYRLTNSVIERMAGQNLLGQSCLELYPELQTMGLFEKMKEVADTGQSVDIEQNYQVNSNTYWFRITIAPIPDGVVAGVEDITSRKRIEKENMQLRLQRQKELLHAILDAQEEERRRISESLHNGVGQILYATKLNLDQINVDTLPLSAEQLKLAKLKTEQLLIEAIKETRHVSHELIPLLLDEYGLAVAMADFCKRFSHTGLHLACYGLEERLPKQVEMVIYRIAQELVNNIVKHAKATRARIEVYRKKGRIIIEAQDNGKGFVLKQAENGIGLRTIYDRTKLFDGKVEIESSLGKGTLITVSFPLTIVKEDM
jgi:PAS domain S-box-containing protein